MPAKPKDPRAAFAGWSEDELRDELDGLLVLARDRAYQLEHRQPTREAAEQQIASFQRRSKSRLAGLASRAMSAMSANPGTAGFKDAEQAAIHTMLASDEYAAALREHYAAKRPTDADLEPLRAAIEQTARRREAIKAELRLRDLDALRADEEAERADALADLEAIQ
jgi:hypothetical protein